MLNSAPMSRAECHRFHCGAAHARRGPSDHFAGRKGYSSETIGGVLSVEPTLHCCEVERSGCEVCGE
jgi:hypothetical protein